MNHCIAILALAAALAGGPNAAAASGEDMSRVNGSIEVEPGKTVGDVSTVNGSIRVREGATVADAETVNGSITLHKDAQARSLETVNGTIHVNGGARVAGEVTAVNGALRVESGAELGGSLVNVNGRIQLARARVRGRIETVAGDIEIGAGSVVEGGLLVRKPTGWSWNPSKSQPPRIVIGPNAVVSGTLEFQREVQLFVSKSAKIGVIKGATATLFEGDSP
jgi:predicted acyltransferase (DUF342 family)